MYAWSAHHVWSGIQHVWSGIQHVLTFCQLADDSEFRSGSSLYSAADASGSPGRELSRGSYKGIIAPGEGIGLLSSDAAMAR